MKRILSLSLFIFLAFSVFAQPRPANPRIILATTTSTDQSGLLKYMLPVFEEKTGYRVDVIAVGTGAAIKLGENGDCDVVLAHARDLEDAFMAAGFGKDRRDVMYNDFIILGPDKDPAKIAKLKSAGAALKAIAGNKNSNFISRGDNSGTHVKELEVWQAAATKPSGAWYKEIGQGMSQAIMMAEQLGAYTLADRATWLAMKNRVKLKILYAGDTVLFNPYGIMTVNPEKWPRSNYAGAVALMEFFVSAEGRQLITSYKIDGEQCFYLPK